MTRRARPRSLAAAVRGIRDAVEPATPLARAQVAWPRAAGERIAAKAEPVRERAGVLTVSCTTATWAQELDLLQGELLDRLNAELSEGEIERLRFVVGDERY